MHTTNWVRLQASGESGTKHPIVCRQRLGHKHRWALQCGSVKDPVTYLPKKRASWSTSLLCYKNVPLPNCFVEKGRKEDVCISLTATVFPCREWCLTRNVQLGMSLASACAPDCWRWCWYLTVFARFCQLIVQAQAGTIHQSLQQWVQLALKLISTK